jgi:general secretion pathway protein L
LPTAAARDTEAKRLANAIIRGRRLAWEFITWWIGELRAMLPERLVRLLIPPIDELVVEPVGSRLILRRQNSAGQRVLGEVQVEGVDPETASAALRPLIANLDLQKMQVALRLPSSRALRKTVDLPAAAEENLRQVMAFEMDRLTPFPAESVYYDVRVVEHDVQNRRIKAALTVLPRASVDPEVELLHELGLKPDAVALPRGTETGQSPWRVPIASNGGAGRQVVGRLTMLLLALTVIMLIASIIVALDRQSRNVEALEREVAVARKEADEGRRLQEEIVRLSSAGDFIVERKQQRPPVVEVLNELTRSMPDDTWLYRMRLLDTELQTFGYSPNASALIGVIENSRLFANAQFRAPLTRDPRIDAEQFHIAFQVQREGRQP